MNRYLRWFVGGGFFLLPFFVNPWTTSFEMMLEPPKLMAVFLLGNLLFSIVLFKRVHWLISIAHLYLSLNIVLTGFGSVQLYSFSYWCAALLSALFFIELNEEDRVFVLKISVYASIILSVYAFFQLANLDPIFHYAPGIDPRRPIATMGQQTKFGAYISMMAVVAFAIDMFPAGILAVCASIFTGSSFTWFALFGGILINLRFIGLRPVIKGLVFLALFSVAALYRFMPDAVVLLDNGRFLVWKTTIMAWAHGPYFMGMIQDVNGSHYPLMAHNFQPSIFFFGYGMGSFYNMYSSIFQPASLAIGAFKQAHNDFINFIFDCGLCGLFLLVAAGVVLAKRYYRLWWVDNEKDLSLRASFAGLTALILNACGNFPFQLAPHFLYGMIFLLVIITHKESRIKERCSFVRNRSFFIL